MRRAAIALVLVVACATPAPPRHSGGTDSSGCHVDSRTGVRHCHGGGDGASGAVIGGVVLATVAILGLVALMAWASSRTSSVEAPPLQSCRSRCWELGIDDRIECRSRCSRSPEMTGGWFCKRLCSAETIGFKSCVDACVAGWAVAPE